MTLTERDDLLLAACLSDVQKRAVLRWLEDAARELPPEKRGVAAQLYVMMIEAFRRDGR